jgi:hypothetical protein
MFSGVFIVDGVGDKGSGNTTTVDVQTLLESFLNMSLLRSACFIDEAFSCKKAELLVLRLHSSTARLSDF